MDDDGIQLKADDAYLTCEFPFRSSDVWRVEVLMVLRREDQEVTRTFALRFGGSG